MISVVKNWNKKRLLARRNARDDRELAEVCEKLSGALSGVNIPVLVVAYNNWPYVEMMCDQLSRFSVMPIIINNKSSDLVTNDRLQSLADSGRAVLINMPKNYGHMVGFVDKIYRILPDVFAYTDPDIKFPPTLPSDFLHQLKNLAELHCSYKAGLALSLSVDGVRACAERSNVVNLTEPFFFARNFDVQEWESFFWCKRLASMSHEIYSAPVDTTFAVYLKKNFNGNFLHNSIRVAGDFSSIHLPWFPHMDPMDGRAKEAYLVGNKSSTWL